MNDKKSMLFKKSKKNFNSLHNDAVEFLQSKRIIKVQSFILLLFVPFIILITAMTGFFYTEFKKVSNDSSELVATSIPTILQTQRTFVNIDRLKSLIENIHRSSSKQEARGDYVNVTSFLSDLQEDNKFYSQSQMMRIKVILSEFWNNRNALDDARSKFLQTMLKAGNYKILLDYEANPNTEAALENWNDSVFLVLTGGEHNKAKLIADMQESIRVTRISCPYVALSETYDANCKILNSVAQQLENYRVTYVSAKNQFNSSYSSLIGAINGLMVSATQSETDTLNGRLKIIADVAKLSAPLIFSCMFMIVVLLIWTYYMLLRYISDPLLKITGIITMFREKRDRPGSFPKSPIREVDAINGVLPKLFSDVKSQDQLIKDQHIKNQELMNISYNDELTGVKNRRALDELIEKSKVVPSGIAVMMIDIDHFKFFNDTKGHQYGDYILSTIGRQLRASVSNEDRVYRYGGEEFLIILQEVGDKVLKDIGERLCGVIRELGIDNPANPTGKLTISVGISMALQKDGEFSFNEIIAQADSALYVAKNGGRNRTVCTERTTDNEKDNKAADNISAQENGKTAASKPDSNTYAPGKTVSTASENLLNSNEKAVEKKEVPNVVKQAQPAPKSPTAAAAAKQAALQQKLKTMTPEQRQKLLKLIEQKRKNSEK